MAIYSVEEILKNIIKWEKQMDQFYAKIHDRLKNKSSQKVVEALKKRQRKTLDVLANINVAEYKNTEFMKNIPDYRSEQVIHHYEITENAQPKEIFDQVLMFEEDLENYYKILRNIVVFSKSQELLDMLIRFKMGQIKEIKALMDGYDLTV